jgi:hypothetical protein
LLLLLLLYMSLRISPQSRTMISVLVLPEGELPKDSMHLTTFMPRLTYPKTQCLPSSQGVLLVHRKNWEPLVLGPALAMERIPGPVCVNWGRGLCEKVWQERKVGKTVKVEIDNDKQGRRNKQTKK